MTGFNTIVTCRPDVTSCSMVPNVVSGNFVFARGSTDVLQYSRSLTVLQVLAEAVL